MQKTDQKQEKKKGVRKGKIRKIKENKSRTNENSMRCSKYIPFQMDFVHYAAISKAYEWHWMLAQAEQDQNLCKVNALPALQKTL